MPVRNIRLRSYCVARPSWGTPAGHGPRTGERPKTSGCGQCFGAPGSLQLPAQLLSTSTCYYVVMWPVDDYNNNIILPYEYRVAEPSTPPAQYDDIVVDVINFLATLRLPGEIAIWTLECPPQQQVRHNGHLLHRALFASLVLSGDGVRGTAVANACVRDASGLACIIEISRTAKSCGALGRARQLGRVPGDVGLAPVAGAVEESAAVRVAAHLRRRARRAAGQPARLRGGGGAGRAWSTARPLR